MIRVLMIRLSLTSPLNQAQVMDLLKQSGGDCIQTGSGLCVKSSKSKNEVEKLLADHGMSDGFSVFELNPSAHDADSLGKDVETFISPESH